MDLVLQSKELELGLTQVLILAMLRGRLEDGEAVLNCLHALKPDSIELSHFDAGLAVTRGFWQDAIRILNSQDPQASNWAFGRALLAYCKFKQGDDEWRFDANELLTRPKNKEAIGLLKLFLGDKVSVLNSDDSLDEQPTTTAESLYESMMASTMYMRA
jgi:type III secretion protein HrpB1